MIIYTPNKDILAKLDQTKLKKFVNALRTTKKVQIQETMTDADDLNRACCLQVCATEVDGHEAHQAVSYDEDTKQVIELWGKPSNFMSKDTFAYEIEELFFVKDNYNDKLTPIHLNDNECLNFHQIADLFDGKVVTVA